jgi:hypothetical protein
LASANERLFADEVADNNELSLRSVVAGPVMQSYIRQQALIVEAAAEAGSPGATSTVRAGVHGGYQLCSTDSSGHTSCDSFTGFRTDAAGRITDLAVDGQLISARLAVGADSTGSQLAISSVGSYRSVALGSKVIVSFKVRNISSHPVGNGTPAFLAVFDTSDGSQFNEDDNYSTLPGTLQPGESVAAYAAFDTEAITGRFSLRTNDQLMQVLVASDIRNPYQPPPPPGTTAEPSASPVPVVSFGCKVLQTNTGEEFNVTTVGGGSYSGTVYVSFHDYAGSGDVFPGTTVVGATPVGAWHQMPAADIGASAEPSGCTASTG